MFIVVEKPFDGDDLFVVFIKEMKQNLNNEAADYIRFLDSRFHFAKVFIDTTGLGSGVFDFLTVDPNFAYKCVDCQFSKSYEGKPFKEVLYSNLKMLLEKKAQGKKGGLHLPDNRKLNYQLIDLRYELSVNGRVKIHHSKRGHDDYCDALALACLGFKPNEERRLGGNAGDFAIG